MKKNRIFVVCALIVIFALASVLTACDGQANINVFGTSKYTVEIKASVQGVPNNIEITEEYVKSIISVHLKWNDGTTTPVSFDDCELTFDKNFLGTKLNIKVKFGKKTGKLSLPFVEPSEAEPEDKYVDVVFEGIVTPDFAEDQSKFKNVVRVEIVTPASGDNERDTRTSVAKDEYEFLKYEVSQDGKELEYVVYVPELELSSYENATVRFYENSRLMIEGEDAIERGMTEEEVRAALSEHVKLYLMQRDETKQEIAYTADVKVVDGDGAYVTFKAVEYETYGFMEWYCSYKKYAGISVGFNFGLWKQNMTDEEIIAGLIVYDDNEFSFNDTTTIERLEGGMISVSMDGEEICDFLYVAYDASENPFPQND